jgi:intracellular multiplication protein IcmE
MDKFRNYIASNVDRHYMQRWGGLIGGSFFSGFATAAIGNQELAAAAAAQQGQTVAPINPVTSGVDQTIKGIGNVGIEVANIARELFYRPPTITVYRNSEIAILFTQPVSNENLPTLLNY